MTELLSSTGSCVPSTNTETLKLVFGQMHNGVECALCYNATRKCDRAWCSAKQLENWSEMPKKTLWRWLEKLEKARRISSVSDMTQTFVPDSLGVPHETTLFNLNVLNQLAMVCIDNEKLNEVSCKFSDMLSEKETEFMDNPQSMTPIPRTFSEALRALADEVDAHEATKKELEAEKQERNEERQGFIAYVDVINEQKAQINNAKTATAMGTASAAKTSYRNLRSAIRQDADGQLPKIVKGFFSTNDLFDLSWFVSLFKASVTKFCNGNPDWTNEKRAIRKGLTKKLNEIVIDCLYMDMNGVKKSTVRALFTAWKDSTKTQAPMNITDDMMEYEATFRSAVGRLICVVDRYQYRDKYNDPHSEPIYGYSYEVIALCLESLPESSCLKYLRDEVEIEDLKRELARVSHDGYELYQVK